MEFHNFSQGDLSVKDYYHRLVGMVDVLRDLGKPILDHTLILIRGFNNHFTTIGLHLCRTCTHPISNFLQVRNDLQLKKLTMAQPPLSHLPARPRSLPFFSPRQVVVLSCPPP